MKRGTAKRLLTVCLTLGAATALAATAEAQDTSQAGAAPMPQDTAPTARAGGDTLGGNSGAISDSTRPDSSRRAAGADSSDTSGAATDTSVSGGNASSNSREATAPDTTAAGQQQPRQPGEPEARIRADTTAKSDSSPQ